MGVVSAFGPEIIPLRDELARVTLPVNALVMASVGVGLVESALGTTAFIDEFTPDLVVFCGTCGALPRSSLVVGDVTVSVASTLVDAASVLAMSAIPDVVPTRVNVNDGDEIASGWLRALVEAGAREVEVATTLAVTTDDKLAEAIRDATNADVEHLEAFSVARACQRRAIPWLLVLGVANPVGSAGRATWASSHRNVSKLTCELLANVLITRLSSGG